MHRYKGERKTNLRGRRGKIYGPKAFSIEVEKEKLISTRGVKLYISANKKGRFKLRGDFFSSERSGREKL